MIPRTFSIQTLGCKVNQYEAEQIAALLRARGLTPAVAGAAADLRVVHTCSVTVQAASKSRQAVRQAVNVRQAATAGQATAAGRGELSLPVLADATASGPGASNDLDPLGDADQLGDADRLGDAGSRRSRWAPDAPPAARVVVTGCWATSDPRAAAALPGVDAVLTHHGDVAAGLDALLSAWSSATHPADAPSADSPPPATRSADGKPHRHPDGHQPAGPDLIQHGLGETSAGTPAGNFTPVSKPLPTPGVNVKIAPAATPQALEGRLTFGLLSAIPSADARPLAGVAEAAAAERPAARTRAVGTSALPLLHDHQTGRQRALLKVQDGCDAHCTYCIIPKLRPGVRSKPVGDAVAEAARLVAGGHVELVLTGIFLGAYGQETALRRRQQRRGGEGENGGGGCGVNTSGLPAPPSPSSSTPLADLVDALCTRVPGLRRLRLSSLEPGDLTPDLLAVLRAHPQVVPHFHLPLQSGSDAILRRMNRQYGRDDFLRMLDRVRAAFDRPALTTDVIVGFPGETDAEFERTAEVVDRAGFIHVHAFGFSPRPGTAAARWQKDFVRGPVVNDRINTLRATADRHSLAYRRTFVGEVVELLVERDKDEAGGAAGPADGPPTGTGKRTGRHGRCERYFPVWFDDPAAGPSDFARVRVEAITPTRTHGVRVG